MKNIWKNSILILVITLLFGCKGTQRLNEFDLAKNYQIKGFQHEIDASFHSINDSITELIVKINPEDLLFSKTKINNHIARYAIGYKVFEGYNNKLPLDTATIHYSLKQEKITSTKFHKIKLIAQKGKDYVVKVTLNDENRSLSSSKIYTLRKKYNSSRSYYEISAKDQHRVNFTPLQEDTFYINPLNGQQNVKVQIFSTNNTCAAKPYEVNYQYRFDGIPDTSWTTKLTTNTAFPPLKNQYYHFVTDTILNDGFSVFPIPPTFPKIGSIYQANGVLGYLISKSEYSDVLSAKYPRKVFENKWLELSGNRQRARNIIKEFYSEASKANQLFTCNQPGWSTDRGMIYIIYGPPRIVYRYNDSEIWIYGEENNLFSEQFEFQRIHSNFSDNIYELKRNINYKVNYNRMINAWIDERGY